MPRRPAHEQQLTVANNRSADADVVSSIITYGNGHRRGERSFEDFSWFCSKAERRVESTIRAMSKINLAFRETEGLKAGR
jgi:hypothetical protein